MINPYPTFERYSDPAQVDVEKTSDKSSPGGNTGAGIRSLFTQYQFDYSLICQQNDFGYLFNPGRVKITQPIHFSSSITTLCSSII